jgi:hypothetical protein
MIDMYKQITHFMKEHGTDLNHLYLTFDFRQINMDLILQRKIDIYTCNMVDSN